ncbi:MAG: zinc-ribbon domain-containing protein, partial [Erysipelotrichaceae bacterium]|nr:zinc-ribbon domain-containing protein [Erysipelotrichaceae bacterium]
MFCNNCGKEILSDDQYCPFCGEKINQKKIIIDGNASIDSLKKRGMMLLEDGDFSSADEYFNRILSLDPENFYGNLGKEMVKHRLKYEDDFYSYYKNLFSDDECEYIAAFEEDKKHIDNIIEQYSINYYLDKDFITDKYSFNRMVEKRLPIREKQKTQIEEEFSNNNILSRIKKFADDNEKKKIESIFKEYTDRINEAKKKDKKEIEKRKKEYSAFLEKTDSEIIDLHS